MHRLLASMGWPCDVVAPSLIPRPAGERFKTDKRDACRLARLHRAGELTPIDHDTDSYQKIARVFTGSTERITADPHLDLGTRI